MRALKKSKTSGYSIAELVVVMVIVVMIGGLINFSLSSLKKRRALQTGAEQIKNDIYLIQSRAVTGLLKQRFVIDDDNSYHMEEDSDGLGTWITVQTTTDLPDGVTFSSDDVSDRDDELEYSSNGFPDFNGESGSPFFTLSHDEFPGRVKEINIDVSGKIIIEGN